MEVKLTVHRREFLLTAASAAAIVTLRGRTAAQAAEPTLPIVVSNKKFPGQKVIVVSQAGPVISGPIQNWGPIWEKATGAKIELVTYPFGQMFDKLRTELAAGAYTADLMHITTNWVGDFVGGGYMETVPDDVKPLIKLDDYYPTFRDAMSWEGKMIGIVYDGNVHNLFYRRDLFENADQKKRFADKYGYELKVPDNWDQFNDVGAFFNSFDWSGTGHSYGIAEPMGRGTGGVYFLIGRGISYSKKLGDQYVFFDPDSMEPRLTEPGWVQALEDWKRDSKNGLPGMIQLGFSETRPAFVGGQVAMITDWGDIGTLSYAKDSKIQGKTGTALVPGPKKLYDRVKKAWEEAANGANHAPYLAVTAWMFAVPKTAKNSEAAWDLAAFFCNPRTAELLVAYPDSGVQPSRKSGLEGVQDLIDAGMGAEDAHEYLKVIGESIGHPNAVLDMRIPGGGEYYDTLDVEASRFMAGEISAQQAMKNAADGWNKTTDRLGRDAQRKLLKLSLGS